MQTIGSCWRVRSSPTSRRALMATPTARTPLPNATTTVGSPRASPAGVGVAASATTPASTTTTTTTTTPAAAAASLDFLSLRGVLFDVDGTLVESDPLHFRAFQEVLCELGFNGGQPIDEHFFRTRISGRHNPAISADLFPDWEEDRRTAFSEDKEERYRRLAAQGLQPVEGLREFLEWVRQRGLRTAAVTNAPRANAEMMLAALGLDSAFEHLVLGEECTRAKPHPDPYLTAMELLGLSPAETMVFEDSPSGVAAGVAAGLPVVALTTGQEPDVLQRAGAVWIVRDFRDVMAAIRAAEAAAEARGEAGGNA
ncbi:hypothetical protein PLESTF_001236300 [Pleodorina starrii]|nr:hypothetical protein PLESTM_000379100 [Pleodorina starrii]GLC72332.1 hypothetical protein PLESTF_001236300 [Pleodorina starrii]